MIDMTGRGRARPDLSNLSIITVFVMECNESGEEKGISRLLLILFTAHGSGRCFAQDEPEKAGALA